MNSSFSTTPAWLIMWMLAGCFFTLGKALACTTLWMTTRQPVAVAKFAFLWVGMNPREWQRPLDRSALAAAEWTRYLRNMLVGVVLLWGVTPLIQHPLLAGWCAMTGLILLLHFGGFGLLASFWRARGHAVEPLMQSPLLAVTLADFWGRRWNRAFRDLAHTWLFLPVCRRWGGRVALWSSFLMSGMIHDVVISIPAGGGYGLPTLYFLLQALGLSLEKTCGIRNRWFALAFVALPAPLLFHTAFVTRVMNPFFHFLGALP